MASIFVSSKDNPSEYLPLGQRTNVIGRAESLLLQVLDNQVSRKHLQIRYDPETGGYLALDMNSSNGVFVNGVKIDKEVLLKDGDTIRIGNSHLFFTDMDFDDAESALHHFKRPGERSRLTLLEEEAAALQNRRHRSDEGGRTNE